jgi:hypothetical protein
LCSAAFCSGNEDILLGLSCHIFHEGSNYFHCN